MRTHMQAPCSICSPLLPAPPGPCALACECLPPAELAMESYLLLLRSRFQLNQPKQRLSVTSQLGIHPRGATASSAFTASPSLMAAAVATAKNSHYDKAVWALQLLPFRTVNLALCNNFKPYSKWEWATRRHLLQAQAPSCSTHPSTPLPPHRPSCQLQTVHEHLHWEDMLYASCMACS